MGIDRLVHFPPTQNLELNRVLRLSVFLECFVQTRVFENAVGGMAILYIPDENDFYASSRVAPDFVGAFGLPD